jgi:hypothetical protein
MRVAAIEKGASGFFSAGIFPMNPEHFTKDDFVVRNTRSDGPVVSIPDHDDLDNGTDGRCSETMKTIQPPMSDAILDSLLLGTQQPSTSKVGLVHVADISPFPVLGISRSERSSKHQNSVIFTATPMKSMLEGAELKRRMKGNTGNKTKNECPKKQTKASAQKKKKVPKGRVQVSLKQGEIFLGAVPMKVMKICV